MRWVSLSKTATNVQRTWILGAALLLWSGIGLTRPIHSWAQTPPSSPAAQPKPTGPAANPTPPVVPPAAAKPTATPPAGPASATTPAPSTPAAVAGPPAATAPQPGASPAEPPKSYLAWMVEASGPFGACIAIESFVLVALITMNLMQIRREAYLPTQLIEDFENLVSQRDYQQAYDIARQSDSMLGKIIAGGMARLSKGYEEAVIGMEEAADEEAIHHEQKLSYIGLIVTTGPMLGLLGTVQGMIEAFRVIATHDTAPKPRELADGIATALFTTLEGLIVAIPAIFAYGLFKNRITRLSFEVEKTAESLMSRFTNVGKKSVSVSSPPAQSPGSSNAAPQ